MRTRIATGVTFALHSLELTHSAPASTVEHARVFGCPIHFGAETCRFTLIRETWETASQKPDHGLFDLLNQHARLLLERLPAEGGLVSDVRAAIAKELRGGDTGLDHVAKVLGMSTRTLQRRLEGLGVVYSDLVDEMRRAISTSYSIASSRSARSPICSASPSRARLRAHSSDGRGRRPRNIGLACARDQRHDFDRERQSVTLVP